MMDVFTHILSFITNKSTLPADARDILTIEGKEIKVERVDDHTDMIYPSKAICTSSLCHVLIYFQGIYLSLL